MLSDKGGGWPLGKSLKLISQCPVCGHDYKNEPVQMFADKDRTQFMHVTCGACKINFLAVITVMSRGISSIGIVTDLNFADVRRLHAAMPISADEAIEAHEFFKKSDLQKYL